MEHVAQVLSQMGVRNKLTSPCDCFQSSVKQSRGMTGKGEEEEDVMFCLFVNLFI